MKRLRKYSVYLLGATLISGCDSSYHAFNGVSGFSYEEIKPHTYQLSYTGSPEDRLIDVETMLHHTARELCRGGAYNLSEKRSMVERASTQLTAAGSDESVHKVEGELQCLAPNYALHMQNSFLFGKNFATNELKRGGTSD